MLPMKMLWKGKSVPHGTLDIIRKCNIECEGCYNAHPGFIKSVDEVKQDLDYLMTLRQLDIVTLAGGEVTLHPELPEIVEHVKQRGIRASIITNGLLLNEEFTKRLKDSGIDLILLHIQMDQYRNDLSPSASLDEVAHLRAQKLAIVGELGIETGICHIIYRHRMNELQPVLTQFFQNRYARFALMTLFSDFGTIGTLEGSMDEGFRQVSPGIATKVESEPNIEDVLHIFSDFGLDPFAYVGSSNSSEEKRWFIFFLCSVFKTSGYLFHRGLSSSLLERTAMRLANVLPTTRSRFMLNPSRTAILTHILLNAVTGGHFRQNLSLMSQAFSKEISLSDKHILLQRAPNCTEDGQIVFCDECPDATIRDGKLLPHCLVDRITVPSPKESCKL